MTDAPHDDEIAARAAEPDDATEGEPDPHMTPEGDPPAREQVYTGLCHGGAWHGRHADSRFPKGFLLIDTSTDPDTGWIYDRHDDDGGFYARSDAPIEITDDESQPYNRWRAAEEPNYDVRVLDDESAGVPA